MMPAPTAYSCARVTSPFSTIEAFAVVPPMSKVMIFGELLRARDRLRADHAAGRAGLDDVHRLRRPRRLSVVSPPFDCISSRRAGMPAASSPARSARR